MAAKKGGLGRGLDALFGENTNDSGRAVTVKLTEIEPNRDQPRKDFDEAALRELSESIARVGLLQPMVVRPLAEGGYRIIAGERRWRACRLAGLEEVPVIIKETDGQTLMEIALIENLQREDLNAVEEALGYRALMQEHGLTQEQVSESVGKSRSAVANALRLLALDDASLQALRRGAISAGHARALLAAEDDGLRSKMLSAALDGASVRELERMAKAAPKKSGTPKATPKRPKFYTEVELSLRNELHRKVDITPKGNGRGVLTLEFFNEDELADFARRLANEK